MSPGGRGRQGTPGKWNRAASGEAQRGRGLVSLGTMSAPRPGNMWQCLLLFTGGGCGCPSIHWGEAGTMLPILQGTCPQGEKGPAPRPQLLAELCLPPSFPSLPPLLWPVFHALSEISCQEVNTRTVTSKNKAIFRLQGTDSAIIFHDSGCLSASRGCGEPASIYSRLSDPASAGWLLAAGDKPH